MKKVALVFVLAVLAPSFVLAWLAIRSLSDQEYLLQRQQSVLYQGISDNLAVAIQNTLASTEQLFTEHVAALLRSSTAQNLPAAFDAQLRQRWPLAQVGFVVNRGGNLACPSPAASPEASTFCSTYGTFLTCRESAEVYWNNGKQTLGNDGNTSLNSPQQQQASQPVAQNYEAKSKNSSVRNVKPQQPQFTPAQSSSAKEEDPVLSKFAASETEFCQLTSAATDGMLARFVDNKLSLLVWYRPPMNSSLVFGSQLSIPKLVSLLAPALQPPDRTLEQEICIALLDDNARPAAISHPGFHGNWKRPFAASEIGEALPHWEVAVYLLNPEKLAQSARTLKLTLGLLIAVLMVAIAAGSWLIVSDLKRQLTLARQKTDFVSNVSHELKTPLTSIRMFSELLAEGRVTDPEKQKSYSRIITAEASRLTRLINNVLDFARTDRNEKKYCVEKCDLAALARETALTFRPHLEASGFRFACSVPEEPVLLECDRDAVAQVIVNLLSNAEKYAAERKEVELRVDQADAGHVEVSVLDRGLGVPAGCESKIFEQFYRAHDSLSSGIQGTGLGLTLARQIARAHGGDVFYEARDGGGSTFILRLPLAKEC